MSSKEGRGGRFGFGRKGDAENQGEDNGESTVQTATADKSDKRSGAQAEIVTAPAVTDGEVPAPSKPVSMSAPVNAAPSSASASASASGSSSGSAPSKAGTGVVDAPEKPVRKVALAPSRARAERPEPNVSDAPIPRSRLGRTRGSGELGRAPRVRRARLKIANIDPWSVMKVAFLFSVALGVILLVAVALLWLLLDFMGFFSTVASTVDDISGEEGGSSGFDVVAFFSLPRVLGMTTIVALVDIVMITALTTLCAYLYNISTDLVGGVEITLAEEE